MKTGEQEDKKTGVQEDRRTAGQEDRRTEGQEERRTGGQDNKGDRGTGGQCSVWGVQLFARFHFYPSVTSLCLCIITPCLL